ncbi:MAG TPA: S9 family peptidase [Pseudomonadota bacterium]|nr:S9 family peptidase [Pseudomonadota bacterium]
MPRTLPIALFALLAGYSGTAPAAETGPFTPMDLFGLQWADAPAVSPDGRSVVYSRHAFDVRSDGRRSGLWLVDTASGASRPLTSGTGNEGQAAWSPDGKRLAYVASDGSTQQIHVRYLDSGANVRLTQLTEGPDGLSWSPDGRWIAFSARVPAKPASLASDMPTPPEGATWAAPVKVIDKVLYRADGAGYLPPGYAHLFVVSSEGGAARQVTRGDHDFNAPAAWLPDSRSVIVAANLDADADYKPLETELYRIDVETGATTRLTRRAGPDRAPAVSPDGRHVAYVGFDDRKLGYQNSQLSILDLASGTSRVLSGALDRSAEAPEWDGNEAIVFEYEDRGSTTVARVAATGGAIRILATDLGGTAMGRPYAGGAKSVRGGQVAYTATATDRPAELAVVDRKGKRRVLTDLNDNVLGHRTLGRVEELQWKSSADGRAIQGWLVYPPGHQPGRKYPLLLEIHGGPFAAYGPHFAPEIQLYAARGWLVLYTNPRGSTSYGEEFANQIHHNYPSQDYDDLMSGVDAVIAKTGVDTTNLYVTGGSGGGVLTAWIVGHTDRFRAAVVAKPVINWYSFVLTSDFYPFFTDYWFAGLPWEKPEEYLRRSPISYVGKVTTPTMLITGENDYRTPISEAEQYYQALKLRRIDTALVRIPGASHSINARPSQLLAQVLNTAAWFEKHAAKPAAATTP